MRAFYVVLAALAFFCETNTVSATGQTKSSKLVKSEELIRSETGQGIGDIPRRLRVIEAELDDDNDDDDEDAEEGKDDEDAEEGRDDEDEEEERGYSDLWRSTVLHNANTHLDDVVNPNTLSKLRGAKIIGQLDDAKNLKAFVNPDLIVQLYNTNPGGLAKYVGKDLFPVLVSRGVTRESLEITLRSHGGLSERVIMMFGDQLDFFRNLKVPLV